jgi:hypothetical protein
MTPEVQPEVLAATVTPPPEALQGRGEMHCSARWLADWLARHRGIRVSHDSIAALGRWLCLQPHRGEGGLHRLSAGGQDPRGGRAVSGSPQGRWWSASNETFQLQVLDRIA